MNAVALTRTKENIISHISTKGPSLPASIASELRVPLLFISAFLSELYHEEKLLMSHLKVGTSSLYLLPGQEQQLENFIQHLNSREREAFHLIKQKKVIKDSELSPVHRVAIRELKDFTRQIQQGNEIIWEYLYVPLEQKQTQIQPKSEIIEQVKKIEENIEEIETQIAQEAKPEKIKRKSVKKATEKEFSLSIQNVQQTTPFSDEVQSFLERTGYVIQNLLKADKREALFRLSISGPHGLQSYLVIAKDKKKIKEEELQDALQQAHSQRLLCLVLGRGELDKKSLSFVSQWSNFLSYKAF